MQARARWPDGGLKYCHGRIPFRNESKRYKSLISLHLEKKRNRVSAHDQRSVCRCVNPSLSLLRRCAIVGQNLGTDGRFSDSYRRRCRLSFPHPLVTSDLAPTISNLQLWSEPQRCAESVFRPPWELLPGIRLQVL